MSKKPVTTVTYKRFGKQDGGERGGNVTSEYTLLCRLGFKNKTKQTKTTQVYYIQQISNCISINIIRI